jgi:hypothetical protein
MSERDSVVDLFEKLRERNYRYMIAPSITTKGKNWKIIHQQNKKEEASESINFRGFFFLVAGTGLEPMTFGL